MFCSNRTEKKFPIIVSSKIIYNLKKDRIRRNPLRVINNDITTWRVDKRIFEGRYRSTYPSRLLRRSVVSSEKLIHRYVESGRADTLRSQYENEGRVWWQIYTTGSSTISRHYDRIMIVIHVGAQKGQTVTLILPK